MQYYTFTLTIDSYSALLWNTKFEETLQMVPIQDIEEGKDLYDILPPHASLENDATRTLCPNSSVGS